MFSLIVNGQDKTRQIADWEIFKGSEGQFVLKCIFPSDKAFFRSLEECEITPTEEVKDKLLITKNGSKVSTIDNALIYANKYAIVHYPGSSEPYLMKMDGIEFTDRTNIKNDTVFNYFTSVTNARMNLAPPGEDRDIAENIAKQLEKIEPYQETALFSYCTGKNQQRARPNGLVYPFGINLSQQQAVQQAFCSQVSIIEGPPGTGKTQTILNILANIALRGEKVAILSNNNPAVENVYEKLEKSGLGYLAAKLGSVQNRKDFFASLPMKPKENPNQAKPLEDITSQIQRLEQLLSAQNEASKLRSQISELKIEGKRLLGWQDKSIHKPIMQPNKYKLSPQKITDFIAYLTDISENRITLWNRLELWLHFRIFRTKHFDTWEKRKSVIHALQLLYYDYALREKTAALKAHEEILEQNNFKVLLETVTNSSMAYLKSSLFDQASPHENFDSESYRQNFDRFLQRFPIIGSSTHSIINSLGQGALLDFVIIDEASQQDIIPGILALGCARNVIIVGDRKQLPHIPNETGILPPNDIYNCEKYSLLESFTRVFSGSAPVTLLKEHYRCHPKIIQFCNQQFYDNELIPMRDYTAKNPLELIITAKGNHARGYSNKRELESLINVQTENEGAGWDERSSKGFIAPYNAQVNLSRSHLPTDFVKKTTHKFQGRECDEIVFSTVLDKKLSNQSRRKITFVDNPNLVNVAVSRAKEKFTLVTGDNVFTTGNSSIAALVRYMEYYGDQSSIYHAPVISSFDLLYDEYDRSLEKLRTKLRPEDSQYKSEQIVAQELRQLLSDEKYREFTFHAEVALIQLVSPNLEDLTQAELTFMRNLSRCDFVFYYRVGKQPLAVIEVDGGHHNTPEQKRRDALKNSILEKAGLPLLRLNTDEAHVSRNISSFLDTLRQACDKSNDLELTG